jgi:hypothetical protein
VLHKRHGLGKFRHATTRNLLHLMHLLGKNHQKLQMHTYESTFHDCSINIYFILYFLNTRSKYSTFSLAKTNTLGNLRQK